MTATPSKLPRTLGIVLIAVVAFGATRYYFASGGDRLSRAMAAEMERQGLTAELRTMARNAGTPAEAARISAELSRKGIARLSPAQLKTRLALLVHMDSMATAELCAARFMGTIQPEQFKVFLSPLSDDQLKSWVEIAVSGMGQELRGGAGTRPEAPTQDEVAQAFAEIRRPLSTPDENRFNSILQNIQQATAEDRCWASLTISKTALALPEPPQSSVLVTLGKVEAGL